MPRPKHGLAGDELLFVVGAVRLRAAVGNAVAEEYCAAHDTDERHLMPGDIQTIGIMATEVWKRLLPDFQGSPSLTRPDLGPTTTSFTISSEPSSTEMAPAAARGASTATVRDRRRW